MPPENSGGNKMSDLERFELAKLGKRIRQARCARGMTQAKLAELIDVEVGHIWRLEKGKCNMGIITYWRLCKVLSLF